MLRMSTIFNCAALFHTLCSVEMEATTVMFQLFNSYTITTLQDIFSIFYGNEEGKLKRLLYPLLVIDLHMYPKFYMGAD